MQRDKIKKREALANPWWESLGFSLAKPLINKDDNSIYGAVFEYKNDQSIPHSGMPPRYVIAFRGKMLKEDLRCLFNNPDKDSRCKHAIQTIETVLEKHTTDETGSVWLAGHSLGARIALLAGKAMAKRGRSLQTYAFNPPHSSFPLEKLSDIDVFKSMFRFSESIFKGALAVVLPDTLTQQNDPRLAAWTPYVYVNPSDFICAEYIGDFKHKNFMANFGLGKVESVGTEPVQHLLSADITVNKNKPNTVETDNGLKQKWYEFKKAHGLAQWWEPNPTLRGNWETHSFRPDKLCVDMESSSSS